MPYDVKPTQFLAKVDHQLAPNHSLALRFNTRDELNENIEPFGGITAQEPRRRAGQPATTCSRRRTTSVFSSRWVNELRLQFAYRDQIVRLARPGVRRRLHSRRPGRADARSRGRGQRRPSTLHAAAADQRRCQVLDTREPARRGQPSVQGRIRLQLRRHHDESRRCRCTSAAAISSSRCRRSPACCRRRSPPIQAVALGLPAAYVQGYGNRYRPVRHAAICRCSSQDDWRVGVATSR